jgi:hypothetical protein
MKKIFSFLVVCCLLLLLSHCLKIDQLAKQQPLANIARILKGIKSEKPEIKSAAPEDPGPTATLVGPLAELAQNQNPAPATSEQFVSREPQKIDHIALSPPAKSKNFLHSAFPVAKSAQFAFEVPSHTLNPRLNGTFVSFTTRGAPDSSSDSTADIAVMLLNDHEYEDFRHGRLGNATYNLEASHNQSISWRVPSTLGMPQKYHLVFSNSGVTKVKFVKADFTISFQ